MEKENVVNKKGKNNCPLSREPLSGICRGCYETTDPRTLRAAKLSGEGQRLGFTLIELLVVVLIIGILASVALPQYQLAVAKARVNRLLPLMKSIENAQEVYKIANGTYANDFTLLDIEFPAGATVSVPQDGGVGGVSHSNFSCTGGYNSGKYNSLYCRDTKVGVSFERYYNSHTYCWAEESELSQKLCKYFCQQKSLYQNGCTMPS